MKKTMRIFILLVSLICCFVFTNISVVAEDTTDHVCIEMENDIELRRGSCPRCGGFTMPVCQNEQDPYGTSVHTPLFSGTECTITYYQSTSHEVCFDCLTVVTNYGYHDCSRSHSTCSQGSYSVCYCEDWPGA